MNMMEESVRLHMNTTQMPTTSAPKSRPPPPWKRERERERKFIRKENERGKEMSFSLFFSILLVDSFSHGTKNAPYSYG
jgi:hypothetical protein